MSDDPDMIRRIVESFLRARWTEQLGEGHRVEMSMPTVRVLEEEIRATMRSLVEDKRTFIILIPKRQDATEPGHFRPISLCTTLYKATAKILAIRLRDLLPRLISSELGAFIGGWSISENVLIAQEFMFDMGRAPMRRSLMGVELDMGGSMTGCGGTLCINLCRCLVFRRHEGLWVVSGLLLLPSS
ncbi:uncharacterized protein LOC120104225 [Phoenix dactylifera]|uniref:Uncharacterized protein LOC120104225 n=1 Tax=Phoenix dactylifera TaxID=42345 RepID=A0A8B8ZCC2_PHODC|nr:uncharacterized protein LOC120104225 [Phoenix dactylifera]